MKNAVLLDTSNELVLKHTNNGIQLVKPDNHPSNVNAWTVANLFQLPLNLGFLNTESVIQNINENTIKVSGFTSVTDTIGRTVRIACKKESAEYSINHDKAVIKANKPIIGEEYYIRSVDDTAFQAITIKMPWYDENYKILGVFFCAFAINGPDAIPLTKSLALVSKLGLLNNQDLNSYNPYGFQALEKLGSYFSTRESECIYHLIRGKTAKLIAKELNLSHRTVQHYIDNIKNKLGVSSKAALIERVIDEGFII